MSVLIESGFGLSAVINCDPLLVSFGLGCEVSVDQFVTDTSASFALSGNISIIQHTNSLDSIFGLSGDLGFIQFGNSVITSIFELTSIVDAKAVINLTTACSFGLSNEVSIINYNNNLNAVFSLASEVNSYTKGIVDVVSSFGLSSEFYFKSTASQSYDLPAHSSSRWV